MKKFLHPRQAFGMHAQGGNAADFCRRAVRGAGAIPQLVHYVARFYPDYAGFASAAVWYVNLGFLPFYGALVLAWQVFSAIGRDESFTRANARRVRGASWLALSRWLTS